MNPSTLTGAELPLVVDLDRTLVATDTLFEGMARLLKHAPWLAFAVPWWLLRGRIALKRAIAQRAELDPERLPYAAPLLEYVRAERQRGRPIVLCTAADRRYADAIASHLGLFDEVIACDERRPFDARRKPAVLAERFGAGQFDYAGSDAQDLGAFAQARHAIVVNPTRRLRRRLRRVPNVARTLGAPPRSRARTYLRALRPLHWVKNFLVYLPVLPTFRLSRAGDLVPATLAFVAFCFVTSSVYVLNDLLDLEADRRHPRKRERPFAAGALPLEHGMLLFPGLLLGGFVVAAAVSWLFVLVLGLYYVSSTLYSMWLKKVPLLDTIVLAGLYTLRVLAGAAAIAVDPSFWLLAFCSFLFLSIAMAKRHAELVSLSATGRLIPGRQYRPEDLHTLIAQGSASGYAAVLVLALYIDSATVRAQYNHPEIIWLVFPLLLYWINKLWLNTQRREIGDDPVIWAITNRVSRAIALLSMLLLLLARMLPRLY